MTPPAAEDAPGLNELAVAIFDDVVRVQCTKAHDDGNAGEGDDEGDESQSESETDDKEQQKQDIAVSVHDKDKETPAERTATRHIKDTQHNVVHQHYDIENDGHNKAHHGLFMAFRQHFSTAAERRQILDYIGGLFMARGNESSHVNGDNDNHNHNDHQHHATHMNPPRLTTFRYVLYSDYTFDDTAVWNGVATSTTIRNLDIGMAVSAPGTHAALQAITTNLLRSTGDGNATDNGCNTDNRAGRLERLTIRDLDLESETQSLLGFCESVRSCKTLRQVRVCQCRFGSPSHDDSNGQSAAMVLWSTLLATPSVKTVIIQGSGFDLVEMDRLMAIQQDRQGDVQVNDNDNNDTNNNNGNENPSTVASLIPEAAGLEELCLHYCDFSTGHNHASSLPLSLGKSLAKVNQSQILKCLDLSSSDLSSDNIRDLFQQGLAKNRALETLCLQVKDSEGMAEIANGLNMMVANGVGPDAPSNHDDHMPTIPSSSTLTTAASTNMDPPTDDHKLVQGQQQERPTTTAPHDQVHTTLALRHLKVMRPMSLVEQCDELILSVLSRHHEVIPLCDLLLVNSNANQVVDGIFQMYNVFQDDAPDTVPPSLATLLQRSQTIKYIYMTGYRCDETNNNDSDNEHGIIDRDESFSDAADAIVQNRNLVHLNIFASFQQKVFKYSPRTSPHRFRLQYCIRKNQRLHKLLYMNRSNLVPAALSRLLREEGQDDDDDEATADMTLSPQSTNDDNSDGGSSARSSRHNRQRNDQRGNSFRSTASTSASTAGSIARSQNEANRRSNVRCQDLSLAFELLQGWCLLFQETQQRQARLLYQQQQQPH